MNRKLFGRDGRQAQLQDLYRQAEQGGDLRGVDPEVRQAFAADQQLRNELVRLASRSAPANPQIGRATLLAAVARQKNQALEEGRKHMFGRSIGTRGLALLAAAGIFGGGVLTVGASGGVTGAADNANDVLATLRVPHKTHDHGSVGSNSGDRQDDAATPAAEGTQTGAQGDSTEGAQDHSAAGDGACGADEASATASATATATPSAAATSVPCQNADDHGRDDNGRNADGTQTPHETPEADETHAADRTPEADDGTHEADKTHEARTPEADGTHEPETPEAGRTHEAGTPEAGKTPEVHGTDDAGRVDTHGGDKTPEAHGTPRAD